MTDKTALPTLFLEGRLGPKLPRAGGLLPFALACFLDYGPSSVLVTKLREDLIIALDSPIVFPNYLLRITKDHHTP